ncbi:hypothetical protein AGMMS50276_31130 [Synergistales bacterium]|nr:hypothetical protein AGMMS50276_31130 [Synergistales bacterium]
MVVTQINAKTAFTLNQAKTRQIRSSARESIPTEETIAAILEGDELSRMYFARFAENDIEN